MEKNVRQILKLFPLLEKDEQFKITSPINRNYNCLAWANGWNNRWMWPNVDNHPPEDDEYWPEGIPNNRKPETFVSAFQVHDFDLCESPTLETGFEKIALYKSSYDNLATHAARQLSSGLWTSKLGYWQDIQHSTPESLEGDFYGKVFCYMKRKKTNNL